MNRRRFHRSLFRLFVTFCSLSLFSSFYVFYSNIRIINDLSDGGKYDTNADRQQPNLQYFQREPGSEDEQLLARSIKLSPKDKRRVLQEYFDPKSENKESKVPEPTVKPVKKYLGCKEIRDTIIFSEIGHGYTKAVHSGSIHGVMVAVKSVLDSSKDVRHCLNSGANYTQDHCYNLAKYKLAKEIILLQELKHPNIITLLGFCWQNEVNSNSIENRGLSMVTELGEPLEVLTLLQTPWQERLRICLGLARLVAYLDHSPIGSLIIRDFRHHQFVLVGGEIKLTDLDDVDNEGRSCTSSGECVVETSTLNWTLPCVNGYCADFNPAFNLINIWRFFLQHILVPESPERLRGYLEEIVAKTQRLQLKGQKLVEMLENVVERLQNGDHVKFDPYHIHDYNMIPEADFPALHDYNCDQSRVQMSCELAVYSLQEAKYHCSQDNKCEAFVVTRSKTWLGYTIIYLKINNTGMRYNKNTSVFLKVQRHHQ